jgi:uncharacterized protein YndB with AHSA1/START domain
MMADNPASGGTRDIVIDQIFPHKPEVIWKVLTTDELIGRWMPMTPTGFQPIRGKQFTFATTPAGAWDGTIHCTVLDVVPNERLAFSWKGGHAGNIGYGAPLDTVVTITLSPTGTGTRLRLVHSGFRVPQNATALGRMPQGWGKVVQAIGELAAASAG